MLCSVRQFCALTWQFATSELQLATGSVVMIALKCTSILVGHHATEAAQSQDCFNRQLHCLKGSAASICRKTQMMKNLCKCEMDFIHDWLHGIFQATKPTVGGWVIFQQCGSDHAGDVCFEGVGETFVWRTILDLSR